ncbi:MAG: tRNA (N(6)-L-threonylcarbamoyladenosine(37)-C(2))-methylthiotransferase MtaB [bacterium]|nr:tRNA (N(6)-L-threonylcarbamoyladenosine(37)-C(2))-methylthiotransferase MtaB [bacterium]
MKIHLRTLGCRLNQAEIDSMARQFRQQGHEIVEDAAAADQVVVNTCAVTHDAVRAGRQMIRQLHRANADAAITVTGCHAQIAPDEIRMLPGVARVVDNLGKDALVGQITGIAPEPFDHEPILRAVPNAVTRTRAFVKVQDGCDNACTFCVTTVARGQGRSRPPADVIGEIRLLAAMGYQEIVLTGVHLGSYGHDLGDPDGLARLVGTILTDTDVPRLRLSSLEPWDLTPGFFALWENPRLCPHLHLPLQSGCDATLKRMLRKTTQAQFRALIDAARQYIPDPAITTDVIVGFPGESDDEFAVSAAFIESVGFAGLHVFRYSKRPGTAAARMRGHIDDETKKVRAARMLALSEAMEAAYAERQIGRVVPVLWEQIGGVTQEGFINVGYTDSYIRVTNTSPRPLTNCIVPARLERCDPVKRQVYVTPLFD